MEHLRRLNSDTNTFKNRIMHDREHFPEMNNFFSHSLSLTLTLFVLLLVLFLLCSMSVFERVGFCSLEHRPSRSWHLCLGKSHSEGSSIWKRHGPHLYRQMCVPNSRLWSGKKITCPRDWRQIREEHSSCTERQGCTHSPTVVEVAAEEAWKASGKEEFAFGLHLLLWKNHWKCWWGGVSCLKHIGYDFHIWHGVEEQSIHPSPAEVSWQRQRFT